MNKKNSCFLSLFGLCAMLCVLLTGCRTAAADPASGAESPPALSSESTDPVTTDLPHTETPAESPEKIPANQWVLLGPDETPPPGAWVRERYTEQYDPKTGGYTMEFVTEYMVSTVTWTFDQATGVLTFTGEGSLPDGVSAEDPNHAPRSLCFPWDDIRDSIATLVLEEGVTRIPMKAFADCGNLTQVELPSTLKIIEFYAFTRCAFSEIALPEGLEELGSGAFDYCGELLRCEIPAGVIRLYGSFRGCEKLETVILHEGLTSIGSECFAGCYSLKRLVVPASVEWFGDQNIQYGSTGLDTFVFLGPPPVPMLEVDMGYTILDCIPRGSTIYYPEKVTERTHLQYDDWSNYAGAEDYRLIAGLPEDMK